MDEDELTEIAEVVAHFLGKKIDLAQAGQAIPRPNLEHVMDFEAFCDWWKATVGRSNRASQSAPNTFRPRPPPEPYRPLQQLQNPLEGERQRRSHRGRPASPTEGYLRQVVQRLPTHSPPSGAKRQWRGRGRAPTALPLQPCGCGFGYTCIQHRSERRTRLPVLPAAARGRVQGELPPSHTTVRESQVSRRAKLHAAQALLRAAPLLDQLGEMSDESLTTTGLELAGLHPTGRAEVRGSAVVLSTPQSSAPWTSTMGETSMMGFGATSFGGTMATLDEDTPLPSPSPDRMPSPGHMTQSTLNASSSTTFAPEKERPEKTKRRNPPKDQFSTFEPTPPGGRGGRGGTKKKKHKTQVRKLTKELEDMGATQAMETWGKNKAHKPGAGFKSVLQGRKNLKIDDLLYDD